MKKKLLYLVYISPILIVCYLIYNSMTITFEKRIIGKWKLIGIEIKNDEKNQSHKITPERQKKLDEIKKMFLQENNILTIQFGEDKKMTVISAKGKPRPYKIIENERTEIDVEDAEGEISIKKAYSFTFKNKLQIEIILPEKYCRMVMMFEPQN